MTTTLPSPPPLGSPESPAITARFLAISVLRRARLLVLIALGVSVVTTAVLVVQKRHYTSAASFIPQARRSPTGNFAGLAAQIGISLPTGDAAQSPQFYADLLGSPELLGQLVESRFRRDSTRSDSTLVDLLDVSGNTPALRREEAIKRVRKTLDVTVNSKTGVVSVGLRASSATLARDVLTRLLTLLDTFNQTNRQTQATAERRFTERRLTAAREEARLAEDSLQQFLQANRTYENSPALHFMYDRLSRNVSLHQQVLTTLSQAFEQARLEEVRDTPVLTIVEHSSIPARADSRGIGLKAIAGFLMVLLVGATIVMMRDLANRADYDATGEGHELRAAWRGFLRGERATRAAG